METLTCRLLPDATADGPTNMAADEVLVRGTALRGVPALRFYRWATATASLGYFQPAAVLADRSGLPFVPFVRRPSGGATLVHHHELTYALAVPPRLQGREPWLTRMHRVIATALASLGVRADLVAAGDAARHGDVLCFQQFTPGDLLCGGRKVVGSAQRKYHLALMQHGSILLRQSEHTPELPGIRELAGVDLDAMKVQAAVIDELGRETGWRVERGAWDDDERGAIAALVREKYGSGDWNCKR